MKRNLIIILLVLFLLPFQIFAKEHKVKEIQSTSGLKAWYIEDDFLPIVAIKLAFSKAGFAYDKNDKQGLSFMVSGLLDEGAGGYKGIEFQRKLEALAINLDFDVDEDYFYISIKTLKDNFDETINLLLLTLTKANFDEEAVERIREQILVLIEKKKENPTYIASEALASAVFKNHPYSRSEYGIKEQVKTFTKDDLVNYTKDNFAKDNLLVAVVGDIDKRQVDTLLSRLSHILPDSQKNVREIEKPKFPEKGETITIKKDIPQSVVLFALPSVLRSDPEFYPLYIGNHIFGGGGFESRLMQEIREKKGFAYSVSSNLSASDKTGFISGYMATENKNTLDAIGLLDKEIEKFNNGGITKQELTDAKSYLINSFPLKMTKNTTLAGFLIAMQKDNLGIDFLEKRNKIVDNVSIEEINRITGEYFNNDKRITVIVGK